MSIAIPAAATSASAARRRPLYVSTNTQSAAIAVNGGKPVVANLAAGSPNCTSTASGRTCTVAVSAPVGKDTFSETLFANTTGTGAPLSLNSTVETIVQGTANTVTLTLDGVVASIAVALSNQTPTQGAVATIPLAVNFDDASGAAIIGNDPFENPITLTNSDATGATAISKAPPVLNSPADAAGLTVTYNGSAALSQAVFGATATGVAATSISTSTLTPVVFNDYPMYAYDSQRSGYNPATTALTPASIPRLHLAWQVLSNGTQTQPIVVTNVIPNHPTALVIGSYVDTVALDALTGATIWSTTLPVQSVQACGTSGVSGTAAYDKALGAIFVVAGNGGTAPNHVVLYKLNAASGAILNHVDVTPTLLAGEANDSHAAVSFVNGRVYVGTGSDCEGNSTDAFPSWRGRVVSVDPASMTILSTFFTTWGQGGSYGGGGVWGWGGVSADPSGNIYVAAGNGETSGSTGGVAIASPFTPMPEEFDGFADHLVQLTGDLGTVIGSNYPGFNFTIGFGDLDYTGVPVIFQPPGCNVLSATQGKGGTLVINDTTTIGTAKTSFALSVPSPKAYYMGNPAYSPATGLLYAAITSSGNGSAMLMPGLAAIGGCGSTMPWHATFGPDSASFSGDNPRSAPTVTAGGVVFISTPCAAGGSGCGSGGTAVGGIWAIDATTGAVLGGGNPVFLTNNNVRVPPTADGQWLWVYDTGGNLYALTVDPTVKTAAAKVGHQSQATFRYQDH